MGAHQRRQVGSGSLSLHCSLSVCAGVGVGVGVCGVGRCMWGGWVSGGGGWWGEEGAPPRPPPRPPPPPPPPPRRPPAGAIESYLKLADSPANQGNAQGSDGDASEETGGFGVSLTLLSPFSPLCACECMCMGRCGCVCVCVCVCVCACVKGTVCVMPLGHADA